LGISDVKPLGADPQRSDQVELDGVGATPGGDQSEVMIGVQCDGLDRHILAWRHEQADGVTAIDDVPGRDPLAIPVQGEGCPDPILGRVDLYKDLLIQR
jgi:hypothetical protein